MDHQTNITAVSWAFPLHMPTELEVAVNRMAYVIGVNKDYPAKLREMISAAAITYQLQNKSIDNVRRTYLADVKYEEDPGGDRRVDRILRGESLALVNASVEFLRQYPTAISRQPTMGEWIGDLTLLRVSYSFERAYAEADKGALYESVAIARMILEQIAWAYAVRDLDDVEQIRKKGTTRAIGEVARKFPVVGRLYGWMSNHAHWGYDAHVKVITHRDDFAGAIFASSEFKAVAYSMLLVLTDIHKKIFDSIVIGYPQKALREPRKHWKVYFKKFKPITLMRRVRKTLGSDADINALSDMLGRRMHHG
jgi:hypothetical protein